MGSDCTKGCEEMEDKYDGDGISSSMDTMHHEGDMANMHMHHEGDMANMHMHHKSDMDMNMHHKSNVNVRIWKEILAKKTGNHVLIIRIAAALLVNRFVLAAKYFSDMNGR